MAYRKSYNETDLQDTVTSVISLIDVETQLTALTTAHNVAGDLIVYQETWQDLDTSGNNVWIGRIYYRAAGIV